MSATVSDPFGAVRDPALPSLALALDPEVARHEFKRRLPRLSGDGRLRLKAIRVVRHKPGRRCVVEYDVELLRPGDGETSESLTLIGKVRTRRSGNEGLRQQEAIWNAGFQATSADLVSSPEPVGVIAAFQMWFQRKVQGACSEALLAREAGVPLARRIAEAIHKVHRAGVPCGKRHDMADELRILRECFAKVALERPAWSSRLERLLKGCEALGTSFRPAGSCGIHRDFYASQVIVDEARLWLIDFDLYCQGDPGLDAGNFIGHITELALRQTGDPRGLAQVERALEDRFVELAGEVARPSVRAYADLTLARHIFLSTCFPERSRLTERLLELCEERLAPYCA